MQNGGHVFEELHSLIDGHVQHVGYALAFIAHLQSLAVISLAVANLTGHHHVRQKIHLYRAITVALARLAAPSLHVEGEASRLISAHFGFRQTHEERSDVAEHTRVGGRIRSWRASQWRLVDVHHLIYIVYAFHAVIRHRLLQRTIEML